MEAQCAIWCGTVLLLETHLHDDSVTGVPLPPPTSSQDPPATATVGQAPRNDRQADPTVSAYLGKFTAYLPADAVSVSLSNPSMEKPRTC